MSQTGLILLGLLIGAFILAVAGIVIYMCRKNRHTSTNLTRWDKLIMYPENDKKRDEDNSVEEKPDRIPTLFDKAAMKNSLGTRPSNKDRPEIETNDMESHASFIIPDALQLLRTCKSLTHRLMATVIDGTSKDRSRNIVLGNLDEIIASAKLVSPAVDVLTKAMYPPIDEQTILTTATDLVTAVEDLVQTTKDNTRGKMSWLDTMVAGLLHDFKTLVDSVQKYRVYKKKSKDTDA